MYYSGNSREREALMHSFSNQLVFMRVAHVSAAGIKIEMDAR